jgi:hypothetical protein
MPDIRRVVQKRICLFYNLVCKLTEYIYLLLFINQYLLVCSVFTVFVY